MPALMINRHSPDDSARFPRPVAQSEADRNPKKTNYADAEPFYQRALAIWEKALGPKHPHVATTLENYAALLRQTARADEAERMEARAEAIRAKSE